jgi:hypothetical protein
MAGALVFLYGSCSLMYFLQYILHAATGREIYFLFKVSTIISAILMTIGILMNRKVQKPLVTANRTRKVLQQDWDDFRFK